jgi:GTP-binding protein SAR1
MEIPELEKVPIIILGNKIDKAGAVPENELKEALGIDLKEEWNSKSPRPMEIFMCSVAKKSGYTEAFKWLSQYLK